MGPFFVLLKYCSYLEIKLYVSWSAESVEISKEEGKSCSLRSIAIAIANIGVQVVQDLIFLCGA